MGAKGARRSTGTKGAQRTFLSTLHPNTILNPNPDPNAHPNPKPSPNPTPSWGVCKQRYCQNNRSRCLHHSQSFYRCSRKRGGGHYLPTSANP